MRNCILIVGNWNWEIYEAALAHGFESNSWNVIKFKILDYLDPLIYGKIQMKSRFSILLRNLNISLIDKFKSLLPDAVYFDKSELILPNTLKILKNIKPNVVIILNHNDNPFIGWKNRLNNRHYLKSIPMADVTLVYRPDNIQDAIQCQAKRVEIFMPYFVSYLHRPMYSHKIIDVIYIGHYQDDGRIEYLDYLVKNRININIRGGNWNQYQKILCRKYNWLHTMDTQPVIGDDYIKLLSSAKMAIVFLSKKHRDVYTRRCFEIPACGIMMLSPRTKELEQLYKENEEVIFYNSNEDLLKQVKYYIINEKEREGIAAAGKKRCIEGGNDEISRAQQIINIIKTVKC